MSDEKRETPAEDTGEGVTENVEIEVGVAEGADVDVDAQAEAETQLPAAPKAAFLAQIEEIVGERTGAADGTIQDAEALRDRMQSELETLDSLESTLQEALHEVRMRKASLAPVFKSVSEGLKSDDKPKKKWGFWSKKNDGPKL